MDLVAEEDTRTMIIPVLAAVSQATWGVRLCFQSLLFTVQDVLVQRGPVYQHCPPISLLGSTHLLETSIENGIRDLVTDLVGVTLSNRLRGEEEAVGGKVRVM
jgi:hypothetical protein